MKMTSAEAAKLLRKLNDEHDALLRKERMSCEFNAATGEDVEAVRPEYDFSKMQIELAVLEKRIRAVKHAISTFNLAQNVPGFSMTVDQLLVFIPQLTRSKAKLDEMRSRLPMTRVNARGFGRDNSIIDYCYANYDVTQAEAEYQSAAELLAKAQNALDLINTTCTLELPDFAVDDNRRDDLPF